MSLSGYMVDKAYLEKLYLTSSHTHETFSIDKNEISEVGPFSTDNVLMMFSGGQNYGIETNGFWRVILKSGRIFDAVGTVRDYDKVLKVVLNARR
jgi:hypothetical protein